MKIVILDATTLTLNEDIDFSIFDGLGDVTIYNSTKDEEIIDRIRDAEVVLCNKSLMTEEKLCHAPNLRYIGLFATGYNNIDLEYTNNHGITVCNAGSYSTDAVAQHVFALILNYYNNVAGYNDFVKNNGWVMTDKFSPFMEMKELYGKTIGIVGYGSIGKKVSEIARAFGMKVLAYSRNRKEGAEYTDMDTLLKKSDIVTMHCPLNKDSFKMCNRDFFEKMKKDSLFINTSRGGVVNEEDLVWALNNKVIGAAALDVIAKEPMEANSILFGAKNLVITPHAAWAPLETRTRLVEIVADNLAKWSQGNPVNVVE